MFPRALVVNVGIPTPTQVFQSFPGGHAFLIFKGCKTTFVSLSVISVQKTTLNCYFQSLDSYLRHNINFTKRISQYKGTAKTWTPAIFTEPSLFCIRKQNNGQARLHLAACIVLMERVLFIELHLHGWLLDDIMKVGCTRCLAWHLHRRFCGFTSYRTNNGPGLASILGGEVGERWFMLILIVPPSFHRHQTCVG